MKPPTMDTASEWDWGEARRRCLALAMSLLRSREDAEEAVQEALVRGFRGAGSCRDRQNPIPWLMTITRRECARLARRWSSRPEVGLEACGERCGESDPGEVIGSKIDLNRVVGCLLEEDRVLLNLRYAEQLTQREIAEAVGLPEGTVKTKLHRIRKRVRARMEA